jgi:hypothetical protein
LADGHFIYKFNDGPFLTEAPRNPSPRKLTPAPSLNLHVPREIKHQAVFVQQYFSSGVSLTQDVWIIFKMEKRGIDILKTGSWWWRRGEDELEA